MTEDPKELATRLRTLMNTVHGSAYNAMKQAADLIDRLTADRERSVPEDVVERVARALAKHNYPGASERDIDEMWDGWVGDARAAIAAMQPEGWVLVPVVPTADMIRAAAVAAADEDQHTYSAIWSAMIAAAPQQPATAPQWQPIETAPKDWALLWLFEPHDAGGFMFAGARDHNGRWYNNLDMADQNPTHWMPLPAAPAPALPETGVE